MKAGRFAWAGASLAAVAFLVVMAVSGALPQQRQLVKFEAKGLMSQAPERITRVEIDKAGKTVAFVRSGGNWLREGGGPLPQAAADKLSMAVQVMHTSGPVRVMAPEEYRGTDPREFGLAPPQLSIRLYEGNAPALHAAFGNLNPEKFLQYMAVEGRPQLYLMSLFVGEFWAAVAEGAGK